MRQEIEIDSFLNGFQAKKIPCCVECDRKLLTASGKEMCPCCLQNSGKTLALVEDVDINKF